MNDIKLIIQVIDFVIKACKAYAATPDGQKELNDIAQAEADMSASNPVQSGSFSEAVFSTLDSARNALGTKKG